MAGRGNPPGSNGGGGRRKGQKSKTTLEREARAVEQAEQQIAEASRARGAQKKLAREILDDAMQFYFGLASRHQPVATNTEADEKKFLTYMDKAVGVAKELAQYQSAKLSSVRITQSALDLSLLTDQEIDDLERLHAKATDLGGDQGRAGSTLQ